MCPRLQVKSLRNTVPELVQCLAQTKTYSTPQELYAAFEASAISGHYLLHKLRDEWKHRDAQNAMKHAKDGAQEHSGAQNADAIRLLPQWAYNDRDLFRNLDMAYEERGNI